jgi:hypothetical protein
MATTTKSKIRPAVIAPADVGPPSESWLTTSLTTEERLERIRCLGKRIDGYIQFICSVTTLSGTSAEAKDKSVALFLERLLLMEQALGKIQEELQLG